MNYVLHTHTHIVVLLSFKLSLIIFNYRLVGGIRASMYNAVTVEEVEALAKYMMWFYEKYNKN